MKEYAVIAKSDSSSMQVLSHRSWDVWLYKFEDGVLKIRKLASSLSRSELVFKCITVYGTAYRYGNDWSVPTFPFGSRMLTDTEVEKFVSGLQEVHA